MAAAAITLLAPFIADEIPNLVRWAERLWSAPKQGPIKLQTVLDALKSVVSKIGGAGMAPVPDDSALIGMIEKAVQGLNAKGELVGAQTKMGPGNAAALGGIVSTLQGAIAMVQFVQGQ